MTYNQLIQRFEWWADAHPMVQQFTHGQFELHDLDKSTPYPAVHVQLADVSFEERVRVYRFEVFVMELHRVNDGEAAAVREDLSNTLQIFEDLIAELRNGFEVFDRKDFLPRFPITPTPFIQEHNGVLTGFQGTIEIETGFGADACDSPLLSHLPPSQLCPDATVTINGTTIGTVGAGETLAALVQYANGTPVGELVSGVWTVPNPAACDPASITTNGDSPALEVASGASQDIAIHDTAGADVGTRSGATVTVGDTTVTVNSSAYGSTEAETTFNVEVVDDGDSPVGSLSGGKWVVPVSSGPVGAKLMKTGQTTSYATDDDGDLQEGRATDFFTLASNNPFGHTFRFTGFSGGYSNAPLNRSAPDYRLSDGTAAVLATAFPENIFIDWSTYDGSTVLGYYNGILGTDTFLNALAACSLYGTATYPSGWRMSNKREMQNLECAEAASIYVWDYAPTFLNSNVNCQVSTTYKANTAQVFLFFNSGNMGTVNKTTARGYTAVRTFTVTGTTLT